MLAQIVALTCSLAVPRATDVNELMEAMRRRANELDRFVATYGIDSARRKGVLTITYDSPDRACVRIVADDMSLSTWLLDERMFIRGSRDGEETHADVDLEPLGDLDRAFDEEFPALTPNPLEIGPGAVIQLGFEPMSDGSVENSLNVRVLRLEHRIAAVGWLTNSKGWKDARHDGDRVVLEPTTDSSIALAVESGFIQEMHYPGEGGPVVVKLTSLVVDESLPADAFTIPVRRSGVADQSEAYQRQLAGQFARSARRRLHGLADDDGLEARFEPSVLRGKLIRIAELAHDHLAPDACRTWSEKVTSSTSEFFQAWRGEYEKARGDESARTSLIAVVEEKRAGLAKAVAATRSSYQGRLEGPSDSSTSTAALILECERDGAGRAFDRHVGERLLDAFDDAHHAVVGDG